MSKSGSKNGKVYLVGAGPGDLGLVTLRAKECIEKADVIVYDHLANPDTLGWTRDDAEIVYVGKTPGDSQISQQEINALLIEKAREGKQVVRLKGGYPIRGCAWNHVFHRGAGLCRNSHYAPCVQFTRDVLYGTRRPGEGRECN